MTTPTTMGQIIASLRERYADAKDEAAASHKIAHNSYGAGYDAGFAEALRELIAEITGDEPR